MGVFQRMETEGIQSVYITEPMLLSDASRYDKSRIPDQLKPYIDKVTFQQPENMDDHSWNQVKGTIFNMKNTGKSTEVVESGSEKFEISMDTSKIKAPVDHAQTVAMNRTPISNQTPVLRGRNPFSTPR